MRNVKNTAKEAGVGLKGVKVKISRDPDKIGSAYSGYTHPGGKQIELFPSAFSSKEELVRTLGHERTHAFQYQLYGTSGVQADYVKMEKAAYAAEDAFWRYFLK